KTEQRRAHTIGASAASKKAIRSRTKAETPSAEIKRIVKRVADTTYSFKFVIETVSFFEYYPYRKPEKSR
ncbi:MAG: hypothetical protein PHN84_15955, partial [Desulfuromonadaceae bacterium]|nr:hypothetical protein [Desulfuromonadaceae bacterium]